MPRHLRLTVLLAALAAFGPGPSTHLGPSSAFAEGLEDQARRQIKFARDELAVGKFDRALASAESALRLDPSLYDAFLVKALAYEGLGNLDLARSLLLAHAEMTRGIDPSPEAKQARERIEAALSPKAKGRPAPPRPTAPTPAPSTTSTSTPAPLDPGAYRKRVEDALLAGKCASAKAAATELTLAAPLEPDGFRLLGDAERCAGRARPATLAYRRYKDLGGKDGKVDLLLRGLAGQLASLELVLSLPPRAPLPQVRLCIAEESLSPVSASGGALRFADLPSGQEGTLTVAGKGLRADTIDVAPLSAGENRSLPLAPTVVGLGRVEVVAHDPNLCQTTLVTPDEQVTVAPGAGVGVTAGAITAAVSNQHGTVEVPLQLKPDQQIRFDPAPWLPTGLTLIDVPAGSHVRVWVDGIDGATVEREIDLPNGGGAVDTTTGVRLAPPAKVESLIGGSAGVFVEHPVLGGGSASTVLEPAGINATTFQWRPLPGVARVTGAWAQFTRDHKAIEAKARGSTVALGGVTVASGIVSGILCGTAVAAGRDATAARDAAQDAEEAGDRDEANQQLDAAGVFQTEYAPDGVSRPYPDDAVDFTPGGFWAEYNWEVFFHAPVLIADRLMRAGRHREAQRWLRFVFDPTVRIGPHPRSPPPHDPPIQSRFWRFAHLADIGYGTPLTQLLILSALDLDSLSAEKQSELASLRAQIQQWVQHPFEPHRIARFRAVAYKRSVVMKYVDNLIRWGDQLFAQDTLESVNEATGLYIAAAEILGPRPQEMKPAVPPTAPSWNSTAFSTAEGFAIPVVDLENVVPTTGWLPSRPSSDPPPPAFGLAFCVPWNRALLLYWDAVADRLFKIRHCQNIAGIVRQLPIYEPPIDPALLVAAAAAGLSVADVLQAGGQGGLPRYRFPVILERAKELAREVQALGGGLLAALEKKDGESLGRLRQDHELRLLELVKDIRQNQIDEAIASREAIQATIATTTARQDHFKALLGSGVNDGTKNAAEQQHIDMIRIAGVLETVAGGVSAVGSVLGLVPEVGPAFHWGGHNLNNLMTGIASSIRATGNVFSTEGQIKGIEAGYDRREEDWQHQHDQAASQLLELAKQDTAAGIRKAIAEAEQRNHERQIEQSREVADFLGRKFTKEQLYDWMGGQLSSLHAQLFRMALDVARRAERAYRFELYGADAYPASDSTAYVSGMEWDAGRKGLLSGEKLMLELRRMESAWMERRVREHEIARTFSLADLAPDQFLELRRTGSCEVFLHEALFDRDYPGHYFRRLKSVSISIPAVPGATRGVQARVRLLNDRIRLNSNLHVSPAYAESSGTPLASPDDRFTYRWDPSQSIVTSHGRNDTGMFEPDHNDPRYLPFEGSGAISTWRIELPAEQNDFDPETLSDVLLHIRYTARAADGAFATAARAASVGTPLGLAFPADYRSRMLSARGDFPDQWRAFSEPEEDANDLVLDLPITDEHVPAWLTNSTGTVKMTGVQIYFVLAAGNTVPATQNAVLPVDIKAPGVSGFDEVQSEASTSDFEVENDADYWSATESEPQFKQILAGTGEPRNAAKVAILVFPPAPPANDAQIRAFGPWRLTWTQALLSAIEAGAATAGIVVTNASSKLRFDMDQVADIVFVFDYSVT